MVTVSMGKHWHGSPCTEANYVTTWNEMPRTPLPVLCRTSAVSTGTVFTSRRGAADLYERGAHKPVLAAPHVFTHEPRHRSDRSSNRKSSFQRNVKFFYFLSTSKQRDIKLSVSEIFLSHLHNPSNCGYMRVETRRADKLESITGTVL